MKQDEFSPLPGELRGNAADPAPMAPEYTAPAPEFTTLSPEFKAPGPEYEAKAPSFPAGPRKRRFAAMTAAVLFLSMLVFPPDSASPTQESRPEPTAQIQQTPQPEPTPLAVQPTETPQPTAPPAEPPTCRSVFFAFSDALRAKLVFTNAEEILSVRAELWDSRGETVEQVWDVPTEDILRGEYLLPDMPGIFDMYMAHHTTFNPDDPFPVPELRVSMTYLHEGEEAVEEFTQAVSEELGWAVRARDGEIRFRTYESTAPISVRVGTVAYADEILTLADGEILVLVEINGTLADAALCEITHDDETWQNSAGEDVTYYYAGVNTPQQGGSGRAVVTVYQKLTGYDTVWSESVEVNY